MEIQCRHCTAFYNAYLMGTCIKFETNVDFFNATDNYVVKITVKSKHKKTADVLIDVVDI